MARKNEYGRFIISAGEVGSFVVCPEAWRLGQIKDKKNITKEQPASVKAGNELHSEWDQQLHQLKHFSNSIRLTIILLVISVSFLIVKHFFNN